ncbi:MAG: hypothetical protein ABJB21_06470 [bacterium]
MKFTLSLCLIALLVPMLSASVAAQSYPAAAHGVAELRARLSEVENKEKELNARARQLDEDLKPENIERSLAGIGSTKPEELREHRRRQLTIEREGVRAQLNLLATSRERLQATIRTAEGTAYQQSAEGATSQEQTMAARSTGSSRLAVIMLACLAAVSGLAGVIFLARRSSRKSTQP